VKALVISMIAGVALCSLMSVPALARPNLGAAASNRPLGQNVHDYRRYYGYRSYYSHGYRPSYYSYGYRPSYYSYSYRPSYYGYGPSFPRYP